MPAHNSLKLLRKVSLTAPSRAARPSIRWTAGVTSIVTIVCAAHGQDKNPQEMPHRPSYSACVKAFNGVTLAINDCIREEHAFQDKRLNTAYQRLRKELPKCERMALRDDERSWIAQRDRTCAMDDSGGTATLLDASQCQLDETAACTAVLESRVGQ